MGKSLPKVIAANILPMLFLKLINSTVKKDRKYNIFKIKFAIKILKEPPADSNGLKVDKLYFHGYELS
jgi:hypothetical protein